MASSDGEGLQAVRPVAPVFFALPATKLIANLTTKARWAEGAPWGRTGRPAQGQSRAAARPEGGRGTYKITGRRPLTKHTARSA